MSRPLTLADLKDPREAAFVAALFELGGPQHGVEAAMRAGYADTPEQAERISAFLLGSSRICRAVTGEIKARFDVAAAAAFDTLLEICSNKYAPASARITAAQDILNRSSIGPVPSRSVNVNAEVGIEELLAKLDAKEEARARGDIIEGRGREVSTEAEDESMNDLYDEGDEA